MNVLQTELTKMNANSVVKSLVKFLEKVHGAVGEYVENDNGTPKCLYFQDSFMKDIFNFYPDRVCIDVSSKKFEIDLYIYIFSCEDSNGRHHIIALGFLNCNDADSILWLFNVFKKHNPNWRKIRIIAAHPDVRPREIFQLFPNTLIIICFFHAFASFKKDVEKMNLAEEDIKYISIELFRNLYSAQNQSEFEIHYQLFLTLPEPIVSYFQEMWLPKTNEWRIALDYNHENIFLHLNLFLEELSQSVGAVLASENSSIEFIKKIFIIVSFKKKEKSTLFMAPASFLYSRFSPEFQISKSLTPYGAKFVIEQLDLSSEINTDINSLSETYMFDYLGISVSATVTSCTCHFFVFTLLPCRHVFAVRKINNFCVFDESVIYYTWNMEYYQHALTCMQGHLTVGIDKRIPGDLPSRITLASHLFEVLQKPFLESSKTIFESRVLLLKKMIQAWKVDNEVSVKFHGIVKVQHKSAVAPIRPHLQLTAPTTSSSINKLLPSLESTLGDKGHTQTKYQDGCENIEKQGLKNFNANILQSTHINLAYIYCVICFNKLSCVLWLRRMGFLPSSMLCPTCANDMTCKEFVRLTDGVAWSCTKSEGKKKCSKRCSVRTGTWLESSNMSLEQILLFCYMWINRFTRLQILTELNISAPMYTFWDKFCQRICKLSVRDGAHLTDDQMPSCSNSSPLEKWLKESEEEDIFVKFLTNCACVHNQDTIRNASRQDAEQ